MVAQKKRGQKAKPKAAEDANQPEELATENVENAEENEAEQAEEDDQTPATEESSQENPEGEQASKENADEAKLEEPKEEKVESGKLLVENLPSSYLFDYQDKLKELFSKYGEVTNVKRGPIIVTELTTTPTLSAIVEFKNKDCLEKALVEDGTVLEGIAITVAVESSAETTVLVGVPYEASTDYVRLLFGHCGEVAHIHEFSKTKYKILRVTFHEKEAVEKALKLDRELRLNGFLVTVSKYRDEDEHKSHAQANAKGNKRQHGGQNQNRNSGGGGAGGAGGGSNANNNASNNRAANNSFRGRGGSNYNARGGNFRGGARGRGGFAGRGGAGAFPRGGFAPVNSYMPPQPFMGAFMNDGQRPNKRLRQM